MRINLFGGPCSGKSTLAANLFSKMKVKGYNVELVSEFIKEWTYINRKPEGYDQCFTQVNQLHREETVLRAGFEYVITDSPLFLSSFYADYNKIPCADLLLEMSKRFDKDNKSINIFIKRKAEIYSEIGRFHNKEESIKIDGLLLEFIKKCGIVIYEYDGEIDILNFLENKLIVNESLNHRMDDRTISEFAEDIKKFTKNEQIAAEFIKKQLLSKGRKFVNVENYGVDNSGGLVLDKVKAYPDFKFTTDKGETLIEIKCHTNRFKFMTFKVCDIKRYISLNSVVCVVLEDGFYAFGKNSMDFMLKNFEHKIYKGFSPNDLSVRINISDLSKFPEDIKKEIWCKEVSQLIKDYSYIFERK